MFTDRQTAGKLLGRATQEALRQRSQNHPSRTVVIAISRGGILVAREVAGKLCANLTVLSSKTICAPGQPDTHLSVVNSRGTAVNSKAYDDTIEGLPSYVRQQQMSLTKLAKTIEDHWLAEAKLERVSLSGKKVVLVNDGCTDGLIELAAARSIRPDKPALLLIAVPEVTLAIEDFLKKECDGVVALSRSEQPQPIRQTYQNYEHVDDAAIVAALQAANHPSRSAAKQR